MSNLLSRFLTRPACARRSSRRPALRLGQLEDRTVPALSVVPAAPAPEWVPVPMTTVDLTFDNPLNAATVQAGDLVLLRNGSSFGSMTAARLVPGTNNQTVRFTLAGLTSPGGLQTYLRPGAVAAANGDPNEAYTADYTLTTLGTSAVQPLGSLVYRGTAAGTLPSGGTPFTFAAQAGQTITLVAAPAPGYPGQATVAQDRGPKRDEPVGGQVRRSGSGGRAECADRVRLNLSGRMIWAAALPGH